MDYIMQPELNKKSKKKSKNKKKARQQNEENTPLNGETAKDSSNAV